MTEAQEAKKLLLQIYCKDCKFHRPTGIGPWFCGLNGHGEKKPLDGCDKGIPK